MQRVFVLCVAGLLGVVGCERIPDWERTQIDLNDSLAARRLGELSKWIWTCRGEVVGDRPLTEMEILQNHFRDRELSILDARESKSFLSSGFLWDGKGHLVVSWSREKSLKGIECRSSASDWRAAKIVGLDSALDIAVVSVGDLTGMPTINPWIERASDLKLDEPVFLAGAPLFGQIQTWPITIQALNPPLATSIDDDVVLLDRPLNSVQRGAVLMDRDWRVVGLGMTSPGSHWGLALSLEKLKELAEALIQQGDIKRPYTGFRLKFGPGEGFRVTQVDVGGPAYEAGLRADDVLLQWDGNVLTSPENWIEPKRSDVGRKVTCRYKRAGREIESVLQMGSR